MPRLLLFWGGGVQEAVKSETIVMAIVNAIIRPLQMLVRTEMNNTLSKDVPVACKSMMGARARRVCCHGENSRQLGKMVLSRWEGTHHVAQEFCS